MSDKKPVVIDKKITGFKVKVAEAFVPETITPDMPRPQVASGHTWKIKPPTEDTGLYLTVNDIVLNAGTEHECRRPFEIFINSKHIESYMFVTALTVTISGLMHTGSDISFLPAQLIQVADPKTGGYFGKSRAPGTEHKGKHYISAISEIGYILKYHFISLGILPPDPLTVAQEQAAKAESTSSKVETIVPEVTATPPAIEEKSESGHDWMGTYAGHKYYIDKHGDRVDDLGFTINETLPQLGIRCAKCDSPNTILMDGCEKCFEDDCGYSKCG